MDSPSIARAINLCFNKASGGGVMYVYVEKPLHGSWGTWIVTPLSHGTIVTVDT